MRTKNYQKTYQNKTLQLKKKSTHKNVKYWHKLAPSQQ